MDEPRFIGAERPPFWLVWSPQGDRPPRFRHASAAAAEAEAERLASENPGREFFVLEPRYVVASLRVQRARYVDLDQDLPF